MEATNSTTPPKIVSRDEWLTARKALLEKEKAHTRQSDELARERQALPWVRIDKEYTFQTDEGEKTLAELFDGRSQLIVYHFMFGPEYEAGCPTCSSAADTFDGVSPHLNARDATFLAVSRAPLEKLQAYKQRMGWAFPWASSFESDFNYDFGVSFTEKQQREGVDYNYSVAPMTPYIEDLRRASGAAEAVLAEACGTDLATWLQEGPGLSFFAMKDDEVYHTYSDFARGPEFLLGYYAYLDRAPLGRNEDETTMSWIRRKDEYKS